MRQANVNGKGAIFQVSDSKWIAKICLGVDENGKPKAPPRPQAESVPSQ